MNTRYEILRTDGPSRGGRIYPPEVVAQIMQKMQEGDILVTSESNEFPNLNVSMERVVGKVINPQIEDNVLSAEVRMLESPSQHILSRLMEAKIPFDLCTAGTGMVVDGMVQDYSLSYCFLTPKKAIANPVTDEMVERAAKKLERYRVSSYEWDEETFERWWSVSDFFTTKIDVWDNFRGTKKEKLFHEVRIVLEGALTDG